MTTSKAALLDSNVLVYAADASSSFHEASKNLRDKGIAGKISLCVCPQVLNEFFAIVTDPKRVTTPREPEEAMVEVEKYLQAENILKILPGEEIIDKMRALFQTYKVKKQQIFDLQLVATMLLNDITRLYTYNKVHFSNFKEIEVLSPEGGIGNIE
jgi:toxin-antitoxin system PIN domain toxin